MRSYLLATALLAPSLLVAQAVPADVARERAERIHWIGHDPLSPARAIALATIPPAGLTIGGDSSDIPLGTATSATVREAAGRVTITGWGPDRTLPTGRATATHGVRLFPFGASGRTQLLVYRDDKPGKRPVYFPYSTAAKLSVTLTPSAPRVQRILAPDGTTVEATEIGTIAVTFGGAAVPLRVMRVSIGEDESQLLINFRDGTTGVGTYPAGRFLELIPIAGDRYTLDLNRAFNPYCAYSSVFPCPLPWRGNTIAARVEAGEKYPAEVVPR